MKLDRLKIIDDITNELMFSITPEEESERIKDYFKKVKEDPKENIQIPYCHKCHSHVQNDIAYVRDTSEIDTDKISWESRCKFLKKALTYEYGYNHLTDEQLFDMYVDYVKTIHEQYDPNEKNNEKKFLYETVRHFNPNTMKIEDLMIDDDGEETHQIRGHCGYDSYDEDKMYGI